MPVIGTKRSLAGVSSLIPGAGAPPNKKNKQQKQRKLDSKLHAKYEEYHQQHDWVTEMARLQERKKSGTSLGEDNVLRVAVRYLDVYSILNLRCVSKEFANIRVDQMELKKLLVKKISRFVDMGATQLATNNCADLETLNGSSSSSSSSGRVKPKAAYCMKARQEDDATSSIFYSQHLNKSGLVYERGVTLYTSEEKVKTRFLEKHLFEKLDWNPDLEKTPEVTQVLLKLWNTVSTHPKLRKGVDENYPNRVWDVKLVRRKRWEELSRCSCNWRLKYMALFYHHHVEGSTMKKRLANLLFRELGHDTNTIGTLMDSLW